MSYKIYFSVAPCHMRAVMIKVMRKGVEKDVPRLFWHMAEANERAYQIVTQLTPGGYVEVRDRNGPALILTRGVDSTVIPGRCVDLTKGPEVTITATEVAEPAIHRWDRDAAQAMHTRPVQGATEVLQAQPARVRPAA